MAEGMPLTMEQLQELVREECRIAIRQELESLLIRALSPAPSAIPEPATWSMSIPQVVGMVGASTDPDFVRDTLAYERQHPDGARGGIIAACDVRLMELGT